MELSRINPVAIVTGARSDVGRATARAIARHAQGGLILVDADETALSALADHLEAQNLAPERVSTLAFDAADPDRWAQASAFITSQYGRLDWACLNVGAATPAETDLVQWPSTTPAELEVAATSLRALTTLLRSNAQGGAVVLTSSAASLSTTPAGRPHLLNFIRAASAAGAAERIRVNAIAPGAEDVPGWSALPWFQDLVVQAGSERAAFAALLRLPAPMARYAAPADIGRLLIMLLSDQSHVSGATLVADGGYKL